MLLKKSAVFVFVISLILSTTMPMWQASVENAKTSVLATDTINITDATYTEYLSAHSAAVTNPEEIKIPINAELKEQALTFTVNAPADAFYNFGISYKAIDYSTAAFELGVMIDGAYPYKSAEALEFPRMWRDDEEKVTDSFGNEYAPSQLQYEQFFFNAAADYDSQNFDKYNFFLSAGSHTITLVAGKGQMLIESASFFVDENVADYKAPTDNSKNYKGEPITIEAENADIKSTFFLVGKSDSTTTAITPYDGAHERVNYIGGGNWKSIGETIIWKTPKLKAGYYNIGFSFRQSSLIGGVVYRSMTIDGKSPFKGAEKISFKYDYNWQIQSFADEKANPYYVYLDEGEHEIALTVVAGELSIVKNLLSDAVAQIGELYLDINMITGETVDIYRSYDLFDQIPDMKDRLIAIKDILKKAADALLEITGEKSGSDYSVINNMILACDQMLNNKYEAHRYKDYYYSNYCSVSTVLKDLQNSPLDLDKIILYSPQAEEFTEKSGFFSDIVFSVKRFFVSFYRDYDLVKQQSEESVTVWVNWGQDQVQVLKSLADRYFSKETGLTLDLRLVNASIIQGVISGNGPDCIISHSRTEPVNLAMRDVLVDLYEFDDCKEILKRFHNGAEVSFLYKDGLYALPDSQSFPVLFYRKDIFEKMNIEVPETWDEFRKITKLLSRYNMNVSIPAPNALDVKASLFTTMLSQNGLSLYESDGSSTTLKQPDVISVFSEWSDFYTKMKLPLTMDFYNRFRTGTAPMGVYDYTLYTTLKVAAPEIDGLWGIAKVPGTVREDGTVDHTISGTSTACFILKDCKNKANAWEFLKWWTETDTQYMFSNNVESILGPVGRRAPSTLDALKSLSWDDEAVEVLAAAWDDVEEIPEYPGSYYVARSIYQSYWNVVNDNLNPKDMLTKFGDEANSEIERKWKQYTNRK